MTTLNDNQNFCLGSVNKHAFPEMDKEKIIYDLRNNRSLWICVVIKNRFALEPEVSSLPSDYFNSHDTNDLLIVSCSNIDNDKLFEIAENWGADEMAWVEKETNSKNEIRCFVLWWDRQKADRLPHIKKIIYESNRLFHDDPEVDIKPPPEFEQIIHIDFDYDFETDDVFHVLRRELKQELKVKKVGRCNGFGWHTEGKKRSIMLDGESSTEIFNTVEPILRSRPFLKGASVKFSDWNTRKTISEFKL